jgi:hypothetical protein
LWAKRLDPPFVTADNFDRVLCVRQSPNRDAPTFTKIAKTPGMSSIALTAALRTSHETMPNVIIKGNDLSDVIAYILSLNEHR